MSDFRETLFALEYPRVTRGGAGTTGGGARIGYADVLHAEAGRLPQHAADIAARGKPHDLQAIGQRFDNPQRALADRAGAAEYDNLLHVRLGNGLQFRVFVANNSG